MKTIDDVEGLVREIEDYHKRATGLSPIGLRNVLEAINSHTIEVDECKVCQAMAEFIASEEEHCDNICPRFKECCELPMGESMACITPQEYIDYFVKEVEGGNG